MALVDRVRNICLTPNTEWPVIAAEPASTGALMTGYVVRSPPSARLPDSSVGPSLDERCPISAPTAFRS